MGDYKPLLTKEMFNHRKGREINEGKFLLYLSPNLLYLSAAYKTTSNPAAMPGPLLCQDLRRNKCLLNSSSLSDMAGVNYQVLFNLNGNWTSPNMGSGTCLTRVQIYYYV